MVAPDPEGHAIGRVGQGQFAVRLAVASGFRFRRADLHVDARSDETVLRALPYFAEAEQIHAANLARGRGPVQHLICGGARRDAGLKARWPHRQNACVPAFAPRFG